ncbi:chromatin assembly factor 1 subunit b [Plakobranchus ocellatus]|uniref:Chromatin assembly factor 1 subunit b n=1 Tax=Plakobranchus ocellatus TaxID=259542 RepID=A0AAV4DFT5_9GAST|nr:chromatin assembly factor 1 subunit b [Plakobranchus ocellatus]
MKVVTPEISWHERDPIYSVDFQPGRWPIQRLASGGVDKIVRIWQMKVDAEGKGDFEFLSNLRRHTATVNVVRFSKNDTAIILWKKSDVPTPANNIFADDEVDEDKESWVCHKTLRGHLGDVADLSWSKDNRYLVSGSVDNSAIVWDVVKGSKIAMFTEHKSYVQGVAFDPLGNFVATLSADRSLRIYNTNSKMCVNNVSKLSVPTVAPTGADGNQPPNSQPEVKAKAFRIFHDDSLRSFFRRLEFSPDGQLLFTPAGCMEAAEKFMNASFIFARGAFSRPAVYLPCGEKSSLVVRVNPQLFQLRPVQNLDCE